MNKPKQLQLNKTKQSPAEILWLNKTKLLQIIKILTHKYNSTEAFGVRLYVRRASQHTSTKWSNSQVS